MVWADFFSLVVFDIFEGAVEAGIAHGLKKRAAGLLPAQDTQAVLEKLARLSEPAAELVKKLSGEEEKNKDGTKNTSAGISLNDSCRFVGWPLNQQKGLKMGKCKSR